MKIKATIEQQLNVFFKHGLPLMIKNTIAFFTRVTELNIKLLSVTFVNYLY